MIKLKPCPFCGGEAYFDKDDHGWQWIECGKCHVATSQRASLMEDCKPLLAEAWNARSSIDSEAIRRKFWDELRSEAETQYDRRLELLGPIETLDDATFRKTLGDGWSAWLLAKRIIENRKAREATL